MRALQLHYTSCRGGLSGNAGFQTRAASEGITDDERREIERRGVYRPPRDLAPEPAPEEIATSFPVAMRWTWLDSGRPALVRSTYTGRDYSGRWGNYFSHALVLDGPLAEDRWPLDLYEWDGWRSGLEPDEDDGRTPAPLPAADLAAVAPASSFTTAEMAAFLRESPERPALLAHMGRAVLLGRGDNRRLVVRDTAENGVYWVASVHKLFPPRHARRLSFATYQDDPRAAADINATTGNTDFRFDEAERRYQFYVFDLAAGTSSEIPGADDDYPALAAHWLADDPDRFDRFSAFTLLTDYEAIDAGGLTALADLFRLQEGDGGAVTEVRWTAALALAGEHFRGAGMRSLLTSLIAAASRNPLPGPAAYAALERYALRVHSATRDATHFEGAYDLWWRLLERHVLAGGDGLEEARVGWDALRAAEPGAAARLLLAREPWRGAGEALPTEILLFLLDLLLPILPQPGVEHPGTRRLVGLLATRDVDETVLERMGGDPLAITATLERLLVNRLDALGGEDTDEGRQEQRRTGATLARVLHGMPPAAAAEVRRRLEQERQWEILLGEWDELLHGGPGTDTPDPGAAYRSYASRVLAALPTYRAQCGERIARDLLDRLSSDARKTALAIGWVQQGVLADLPPAVRQQALELANAGISLAPRDPAADELAERVETAARSLGQNLQPNRPRLRRGLGQVGKAPCIQHADLKALGQIITQLDTSDRTAYLTTILPSALALATDAQEHQAVLAALAGSEPQDAAAGLRAFLVDREAKRWAPGLDAALAFWIGPRPTRRAELQCLETVSLEGLEIRLAGLPTKVLERLEQQVEAELGEKGLPRWQQLAQRAAHRRQERASFWRRWTPFARGKTDHE